jgi:hypothetical protein
MSYKPASGDGRGRGGSTVTSPADTSYQMPPKKEETRSAKLSKSIGRVGVALERAFNVASERPKGF